MALSTPPSPKGRWCGGALYCTHSPMRGRTSLACVFRGQAAAHWHVGDGGGSDAASIRCHRCRCDRSGRRCRAAAVAVAVRVPFRPFWRPHARQGGRRHTAHAQRWGLGRWQAGAPAQDDHGLEARPDDQMGRRSWSAPRVWPAACCDRATEKRWGGGGGGGGHGHGGRHSTVCSWVGLSAVFEEEGDSAAIRGPMRRALSSVRGGEKGAEGELRNIIRHF
ncbi:hypothetical protein I4F81_005843 [Pyropia yezoensis]|uniref:Uncharacterized protein n=1 Tax=Pyropia yezoensis TaxID=2788 RepID=A0ACC3BZV4_PYRYE|nr:hypothetical protein I4F81_005843 [Neopyropia yezoensis]